MTEKLMPCPFCGSQPNPEPQNDDCPLPGDYSKDGGRYYQTIWCEKCGSEGGKRHTGAEAITAWNTRHPTPAADEVDWDEIRSAVAKAAWPSTGLVDEAMTRIRAAMHARSAEKEQS